MSKKTRPTPEQISAAIDRMIDIIATGVSVRSAAKKVGIVTKSTFFCHINQDKALQERYHAAKNAGIHAVLDRNDDDLDDLAAELRATITVPTPDGPITAPKYDGKLAVALVNVVRLRVDYSKWCASKLLPRMYGDKLVVQGPDGDKVPMVHLTMGSAPAKDAD